MLLHLIVGLSVLLGAVLLSVWLLGSKGLRKHLQATATAEGWTFVFKNARDFRLQGKAGKYPFSVTPFLQQPKWLKVSLPMANPNRKFILIGKQISDSPWRATFDPDPSAALKHDLGSELEMCTNDPWFSSFLLGEALKEKIQTQFAHIESGAVFILNDEMAAILPGHSKHPELGNQIRSYLDLMTAIKEELN